MCCSSRNRYNGYSSGCGSGNGWLAKRIAKQVNKALEARQGQKQIAMPSLKQTVAEAAQQQAVRSYVPSATEKQNSFPKTSVKSGEKFNARSEPHHGASSTTVRPATRQTGIHQTPPAPPPPYHEVVHPPRE